MPGEIDEMEMTLSETLKTRDERKDEMDYLRAQNNYALKFCEPNENVTFVGETVILAFEKKKEETEIQKLMKRLQLVKLRRVTNIL